ncbi:MAG TPA: hypothetical protein VF598_14420 [Hymenobacter sp.]|jgi:hypothetical protein
MKFAIHFVLLIFVFSLGSCKSDTNLSKKTYRQSTPTKELADVLKIYIKSDSLKQESKIYAAFIMQDSVIGNTDLYLCDVWEASPIKNRLPQLSWQVEGKTIFVYSGLENITSDPDSVDYSLINKVILAHANYGGIDDRPFRRWKISIKNKKVIAVNKNFYDFYPFGPNGIPPPFPIIINDQTIR